MSTLTKTETNAKVSEAISAAGVLAAVKREHASLLADDNELCESDTRDTSPLDTLAMAAGYSGIKQVGNDWNVWSSKVSEVALMLCECVAKQRAEAAGLGEWSDLDEFLALASVSPRGWSEIESGKERASCTALERGAQ